MMHYRRLRLNLSLWAWLPLPPREMSLLHALRSVRAARCLWSSRLAATRSGLDWSKVVNRPGGHVTGILFNQNVLSSKRVELLREIAPNVSRIALLINPTNPNVDVERSGRRGRRKEIWSGNRHPQCQKRTRNRRRIRAVAGCQCRRNHHRNRSNSAGSTRADRRVCQSAQAPDSWVSYGSSQRRVRS